MELLRQDFVNAWVVAKHLPRMAEEAADPAVRTLARRAHESYLYPVDSQVFSSAGELLDHVSANDLFAEEFPLDRYFELLEAPRRGESR
jgi:hypothetical protein